MAKRYYPLFMTCPMDLFSVDTSGGDDPHKDETSSEEIARVLNVNKGNCDVTAEMICMDEKRWQGNDYYNGAVYLDGLIYVCDYHGTNVHVFDPSTESIIDTMQLEDDDWIGPAIGADKRIYFATGSKYIGVLNPQTKETERIPLTCYFADRNATAYKDKIIGHYGGYITMYDVNTQEIEYIHYDNSHGTLQRSHGSARDGDGNVIFVAYDCGSYYATFNVDTKEGFGYRMNFNGGTRPFYGCNWTPYGVYARPSLVNKIVQWTDTAENGAYTIHQLDKSMYCLTGGMGIDGCLYWPDSETRTVKRINPETFAIEDIHVSNMEDKYMGQRGCKATLPDGTMYFFTFTGKGILKLSFNGVKEQLTDKQAQSYFINDSM